MFFSLFLSAQIFVSENTQLFIAKDAVVSGDIEIIHHKNPKAEIYVSKGSLISGINHLSNVEVIEVKKESPKQIIATAKLNNKNKDKPAEKADNVKALSKETQQKHHVNINSPSSDDVLSISKRVPKSFVPPHSPEKIWLLFDQVGIDYALITISPIYLSYTKAVVSINTVQLRIRPPPSSHALSA